MRGADLVLNILSQHEANTIFGYPGGAIMPIYDALYTYNMQNNIKINHYLCCHEQGAGFAAVGYARSTGKTGICLSTSGPGFTNLITSITDAKIDSVPLVVITGQVALPLIGTDAFQEVDTIGLSLSITKHSFLVKHVDDLEETLHQAFKIASSGRPGPVLLDIPKDIQLAPAKLKYHFSIPAAPQKEEIDTKKLFKVIDMIKKSSRPVFYVGGGVPNSGSVEQFREILHLTQIPAVSTLKGLGSIPKEYPYNLEMIGMHGQKCANLAVQECDLLISVGARFDDRVTGNLNEFAADAKVIHLDIDSSEIGKLRIPDLAIKGDLKDILSKFICSYKQSKFSLYESWKNKCISQKTSYDQDFDTSDEKINGPYVLKQLSNMMPKNTIISCDVGQHQMWVAQYIKFDHPKNHLTSGGLGTMGYGLPSAIGAKLARPNDQVINVSGDGSFMMNLQELGTIKRFKVPVKIIILDNSRLGMVKQWQELFFEKRYSETLLLDNPDFVTIGKAYGIQGRKITKNDEVIPSLKNLISSKESFILHIKINEIDNVWPIVPPNKANHKMLMEN